MCPNFLVLKPGENPPDNQENNTPIFSITSLSLPFGATHVSVTAQILFYQLGRSTSSYNFSRNAMQSLDEKWLSDLQSVL